MEACSKPSHLLTCRGDPVIRKTMGFTDKPTALKSNSTAYQLSSLREVTTFWTCFLISKMDVKTPLTLPGGCTKWDNVLQSTWHRKYWVEAGGMLTLNLFSHCHPVTGKAPSPAASGPPACGLVHRGSADFEKKQPSGLVSNFCKEPFLYVLKFQVLQTLGDARRRWRERCRGGFYF